MILGGPILVVRRPAMLPARRVPCGDGANSTWSTPRFNIGFSGNGSLAITNGGHVTDAGIGYFATFAGANGTAF